jgi:hypothetical protein
VEDFRIVEWKHHVAPFAFQAMYGSADWLHLVRLSASLATIF